MILEKHQYKFECNDDNSFVAQKDLLQILNKQPEFKDRLCHLFEVDPKGSKILNIANSKNLIDAILNLDSQGVKIDI